MGIGSLEQRKETDFMDSCVNLSTFYIYYMNITTVPFQNQLHVVFISYTILINIRKCKTYLNETDRQMVWNKQCILDKQPGQTVVIILDNTYHRNVLLTFKFN